MSRSSSNRAPAFAPAAWVTIAASGAVLLLLAGLHALSPEFDPSLRAVSEYAKGRYGWVLSLMFASWALSSWSLAVTVWPSVKAIGGRFGLGFLIAAGGGEAMASVFDINHPLHGLAGMIGVLSLPIAAMLISVALGRTQSWSAARNVLLWTANFTWASLALLVFLLMAGYIRAGNRMTRDSFAFMGWANRLLILAYCVWQMVIAGQALRRPRRKV
jgi:hypothetical protein